MGKPYKSELTKIASTYEWANRLNLKPLSDAILCDLEKPLLIVGSGGSLSACHYAVSLYQSHGGIAKAMTPLELFDAQDSLKNTNILFISASGKNSDILFGFDKALSCEPNSLITVSLRKNSKLFHNASKYSICKSFEFEFPARKDGFLATNSLVAFYTILFKVFNSQEIAYNQIKIEDNYFKKIHTFFRRCKPNTTFIILYSRWGQSIGVDIESKFVEAVSPRFIIRL